MTRPAVLILGGRSDIGLAIARRFAADGHPIQLAARDAAGLEADRRDIELRHRVAVSLHDFDVLDTGSHAALLDGLPALPGIAVCVVGLMGEQAESERDPLAAARVMRSNYEGPALILAELANRFEARGSGTLVGVSSVAGERGRRKNYVYGSAKAGFTAFLSGLRNRLAGKGVHVVTVLPGFVATRMTAGMDLPAKLTAAPEEVAASVERAVARARDVVYVRPVWALVMGIIRAIPESRFKRMDI
ncbi:oxidoreductase, short-chain dehydrogenase/reductase family [Rubellimicrobium mesophilum DSM 19309]|uniref:Oxidoreductase, short-chain dehydrogenase/reductase family n=1 Tax=Rubellimicrobium mesophilum DSM 19309 TaxID=442562 RepID=A0A017HQW6_9RHOB|nr:SDR family oxidoreductase [Rubellimicrobium mesophilum]EYD76139.1 oxidoreductase, short-chain dehydrogenase/reductase family [Rubellimicrobium mesophilum DSM 19309]